MAYFKEIDAIVKEIDKMTKGKNSVVVGVFGPRASKAKKTLSLRKSKRGSKMVKKKGVSKSETVYDVALKNEYGLGVPKRSFIRDTVSQNKIKILDKLSLLIVQRGLQDALELTGLDVVGMIKQRISDGIKPENSPVTVAIKGSSKPLVNTGQLVSSIFHEVRKSA